jgi:heme oxygenase
LLLNDLAYLGIDIAVNESKAFQKLAIPKIESLGHLIGVLYTIEGSTLGGQFISRYLEKYKGMTSTSGACFFNGYGELTEAMWQEFLIFAETIAEKETECQVAIESACLTFSLFEQALDAFTEECVDVAA